MAMAMAMAKAKADCGGGGAAVSEGGPWRCGRRVVGVWGVGCLAYVCGCGAGAAVGPPADVLYAGALKAMQDGAYETAASQWAESNAAYRARPMVGPPAATETGVNLRNGLRLRAVCLTELARYDEALEDLDAAAALIPGSDVELARGGALLGGGDYVGAIKALDEVIRVQPSDRPSVLAALAWDNKGVALGRCGDWGAARAAHARATAFVVSEGRVGPRFREVLAGYEAGELTPETAAKIIRTEVATGRTEAAASADARAALAAFDSAAAATKAWADALAVEPRFADPAWRAKTLPPRGWGPRALAALDALA